MFRLTFSRGFQRGFRHTQSIEQVCKIMNNRSSFSTITTATSERSSLIKQAEQKYTAGLGRGSITTLLPEDDDDG
ncbi:hypothetical protein AKO1_005748 [Acrasis kona]|uniref:Uncharacterized protein n=1 Tax=Acrasis kona TaxID=1008807 RepID=A0AAW2YLA0_9EUKA